VGSWAVRLLATKDHELCRRIAVLRDSDLAFEETPTKPSWAGEHDDDVVLVAHSHPTLEPELTLGNEELVAKALEEIDVDVPTPVTPQAIHLLFRSARKPKGGTPTPAGPAARQKGEFALALAGVVRDARRVGTSVSVPTSVSQILDFLYATLQPAVIEAATEGEIDGQADGGLDNEGNGGSGKLDTPG
jgi:putative ATP-dependent endonuclease of OLD family